MDFLFFSAADAPIFARNDAESATWTVQDMQLRALFPYDAGKVIQRGQRIGFTDETGVFQPFEIRKVRTYEPDHYQEITAEHICISELTDEHAAAQEFTNVSAASALGTLLTGTLWSVGTDTSSGTSSGDTSMGAVWQSIRTIEQNWNVYITPRVTWDATGITHRYLDIAPAGGTWRGLRLSIDKNADDVGVTWDDTSLVTAMYGYGGSVNDAPLTFASVTWSATADHPAKPEGQTYIEDPAATAAYGRNGRARFGFYQNGDIKSASVLLEKTWQALKLAKEPTVTIDCSVRDLYRLGYADEPIRLHDTVIVDVSPIGVSLQREIVQLTVDLLDPTATRPTIGAYIPNIVYIERENARRSGGGGGRGGGGGYGQSEAEYQLAEFYTQISANEYAIQLEAGQRKYEDGELQAGVAANAAAILLSANNITSLVVGNGAQLDADGHIVVDANGVPVFTAGSNNNLYSQISQNAGDISLVVSNGSIKAASIVAAVNSSGSSVTIDADKVYLNGQTIATSISANSASITNLTNGTTTATLLKASNIVSDGQVTTQTLSVGGAIWASKQMTMTGLSGTLTTFLGTSDVNLGHYHGVTFTESQGTITLTLGSAQSSAGSDSFRIADTQTYLDGVAAAYQSGKGSVTVDSVARTGSNTYSSNKKTVYFDVIATASNGETKTQQVSANVTTSYDAGYDAVTTASNWTVTSYTYNSGAHTYTVYVRCQLENGNYISGTVSHGTA